eukprot:767668-Hanusia_phi.AAC.2
MKKIWHTRQDCLDDHHGPLYLSGPLAAKLLLLAPGLRRPLRGGRNSTRGKHTVLVVLIQSCLLPLRILEGLGQLCHPYSASFESPASRDQLAFCSRQFHLYAALARLASALP